MILTRDQDALVARLERAERHIDELRKQDRRLKCGGMLLAAVASGIMLLAAQPRPQPKALEAQKLVLRDSRGVRRAELAAGDEQTELALYDPRGSIRLKLGAGAHETGLVLSDDKGTQRLALAHQDASHGAPAEEQLSYLDAAGRPRLQLLSQGDGDKLTLFGSQGKKRGFVLASDKGGPLGLGLLDEDGKQRVIVGLDPRGAPGIMLNDENGNARVVLGANAVSSGALVLRDRHGKQRLQAALDRAGTPSLTLNDDAGHSRVVLMAHDTGKAFVGIRDKDGKDRLVSGVDADGSPRLNFNDERGSLRLEQVYNQDESYIGLYDRSGKLRTRWNLNERGPDLRFFDETEGVRLFLGLRRTGPTAAWLGFYDDHGKPRVGIGLSQDGPRMEVLDKDGRQRARMEIGSEGPTLRLIDRDGRPLFSKP